MLETIREFAEEQLVASGEATRIRDAHARHFAGREADVMALWDSPRQPEAYEWLITELANLRTAFRWASDQGDLDTAATIVTYGGLLGMFVENYEAAAWAEELIERARTVDHPRLVYLYAIAAQCHFIGRPEEGVRYVDAGRAARSGGCADMPYGVFCHLGGAYLEIGRPDRWAEMCRAEIGRGADHHAFTRASLVMALALAGPGDEAIAETAGLVDAAESTRNPGALSYALLAYGYANRDADPPRALNALRRGLRAAQESGNRANESILAMTLGNVELSHGDPMAALDCITLAIHNYHEAGNVGVIRVPVANLATLLDRLEDYESAARIAGFAIVSPIVGSTIPEIGAVISHLREILGDENYESLAREGEAMTTAAMTTYVYEEIEKARQRLRP